jgi:hypothetical protein
MDRRMERRKERRIGESDKWQAAGMRNGTTRARVGQAKPSRRT